MNKHILIIDDDETLCFLIDNLLTNKGFKTRKAFCLEDGYVLAESGNFDIIMLDVQLPDGSGLEQIPRFSTVSSQPEIIIMTADANSHGAEKAIESGAWDYLEKTNIVRELLLPVTRALQYREEKCKIPQTPIILKRENLIGESKVLLQSLAQLSYAAGSEAPVLISGETGTGKEVFAHVLHENSSRQRGNFIVVDCAALPPTLIESNLFGHTKGAFTGADRESRGLISYADGGTLFLDEIGELPLEIQKTFLRVLQEHRYRPVGGSREISLNLRIIAATNRSLEKMVASGQFREDLLFRLRSFHLELPPLRKRQGDITKLTHHILDNLWKRQHLEVKSISHEFLDCLECYPWPGNIRELQQTLEEVIARSRGHQTLFGFHLPDRIRINAAQAGLQTSQESEMDSAAISNQDKPTKWKQFKADMETQYLKKLMSYCDEDIKSACEVSGISRARLYEMLRK